MIQKPEIQYIGQFYVYGSEARKLEQKTRRKRPKTRLPMARMERIEKIRVDPVALVGITVAIVMLAVMVVGVLQIQEDWQAYSRMSTYVSQLKRENAELRHTYRASYDLEDIQKKASGLGLVPKEDVKTVRVAVSIPTPEPEPTFWEELVWFWEGLFA